MTAAARARADRNDKPISRACAHKAAARRIKEKRARARAYGQKGVVPRAHK